ncbi:hypothetical protein B0J11DRAFT_617328 [Dendryphion nanum]|uniref:Transport protein USO1 n=1 Tax=Dendryphion nanum TaxID=256645 RepID=A0A9P9DEH4_9PLEO|nr:hypothetical protein B0J11DRAFT_617328 [Dendryphion nanum]
MSADRESSRDRELVKHQHSFIDGRMHIPMWDSSDPVRAPPPLPLNPGSPSLTTRPNTSAAIAQAARALEEKARESMPSSYTTNPMPSRSPERSLIKGAQHKRMQSLQTTSVRDLRSFLDGVRSPERSPERPTDRSPDRSPERSPTRLTTPSRDVDRDYFTNDQSPTRLGTPTPSSRDILKETPALRPSARSYQKAILGENTPPSATMLALQTMTIPREHLDPPLSNVTNSPPTARSTQSSQPSAPPFDAISNQLLSITTIVSNLQKDMTQLSRRSKDNATDLISLKEATSARDEDIRKSLKELLFTRTQSHVASTPDSDTRFGSSMGMKDPHMTPTKSFAIPRMPSPNSFILDERIGSPNPYSVEGAASVAMLEKIIREMVTKDGQERLIANLQKLVDKATGDTAQKVTELVEFVKQGSAANPLAHPKAPDVATFQPSAGSGQLTRTMSEMNSQFALHKVADGNKPYTSPKAADFVSDEMLKFLRKIKDSVAEAGCITMGTKSLIQDLRGEVLGMGRELARKIEEVEQTKGQPLAIESGQPNHEVVAVIQQGLDNVKHHLDEVMRERRRQSISSTITRNTVDNQEVYDVVKHALAERGLDQLAPLDSGLDKEAIISAIREAYEAYKPNVEIEQFGLERDEILQCLREGLQEYRGSGQLSKEEIMQTVHDSIQNVKLPPPINEAHEIREEVLMAVRECLEDFRPSLGGSHMAPDSVTLADITNAIREGISIDISQDDLHAAVKAAMGISEPLLEGQSNAVMQRLQSLVDEMHSEFKAYSSANGRDTEQVLDALKDGLDTLRGEIESYVDKTQDITQKDEIMDSMRVELEQLRKDIQGFVSEGPQDEQSWSRIEMVHYIKSEFEQLQENLAKQLTPSGNDKAEILSALNEGLEGMKSQVAVRGLDLDSNEEINEAMKLEFDQLKDVILGDNSNHKEDILEKLQAGLDSVHTRLDTTATASEPNADVLATIRDEFEHLRETLGGTLVRAGGAADKEDIIDAVRELVDGLRTQMTASHADSSKDQLSSVLAELEHLKESLGSALVPTGDSSVPKEAVLEAIKSGFLDLKDQSKSLGINEELLEAFRGELEQIRQSNILTRQHTRADTEEVLEAVRLGLDDLQSHLEKKLSNPDHQMSATGEIIDALNDGLEGLRSDVTKMADKPVDMTVSYEILDTLKEGFATLRADFDKLKGREPESDVEYEPIPTGNEVVLAEDPEAIISREMVTESLRRDDLDKMEVMLSQLQVKVEAMDANIQTTPSTFEQAAIPGSAMKDDLVSIEDMLKDLQASVLQLQERDTPPATANGVATKEDTDAIETLLGNMKAKIEELSLPDPTTMVTKENLDDVELVVRTTSESLDALSKKIAEEGATKGDVAVVQVIVDDIKQVLEEMKTSKPEEEEVEEKASKADVDALTEIALEIKIKMEEMKTSNAEELPSKADMDQLKGLLDEFRDSHEKFKENYEADIFKTANNFDDRRKEAEDVVENISVVKVMLDDLKEEIKSTLAEGGSIDNLKESFKSLEDNIGTNLNVTADVKELMETVSREFDRAHGAIEGLQNSQEEKSALALEKQDDAKTVIVAVLSEKVDERFDTLMAKYDDAQLLADEQAKVRKEKAEEQEKILDATKTMSDELRLTIDTLGASITGLNDRFEDATQKLSTDSEVVFAKVDEAIAKLEEQKIEDKSEHSHTRDEIANVERIFNGLQDNITEYHPKFMIALREIEALVKQHYEHSQQTKDAADEQVRVMNEEARARSQELQLHFSSLPALLPAPPAAIELPDKYDDTHVHQKLDKLIGHADLTDKYDDTHVHEKLDKLIGHVDLTEKYDDTHVREKLDKLIGHADAAEKYDDTPVQEKLDKLISHVDDAEKSGVQLERLDQIREQVKATATEVSEFIAKQTQLITDGNETKEREAEELGRIVERKLTQKEQLEEDIEGLRAEKERLVQELKEEKERSMQELKEEKDRTMLELKEEKDSILAIVAALQVERENLANQKVRLTGEVSSLHTALDIRREELHMMDAKADALERRILNGIMDHSRALMMAKGPKSPTKHKKRPNADISNDASKLMPPPSAAANALSLALKPRPAIRRNGPPPNPASRRIHSLSQISGNTPTGAQNFAGPIKTANLNTGGGLKRSHSVKTNYLRKGSWGGRPSVAVANKENEALSEEDETEIDSARGLDDDDDDDDRSVIHEDVQSEAGTERRHSLASGSYARSSFGGPGSDYTYASGSSYMTGSDIDRRTSYGSHLGGDGTIEEGSEYSQSEGHSDLEDEDPTETVAPSEITGTEVSLLPTQSEVDRAVELVKEDLKKEDLRIYAAPSDSGVGSEVPTALLGIESEADYFRRAAEEESTVG